MHQQVIIWHITGNWFTARAFNFYQDLTKVKEHPTAGIAYSTTEKTNEPVIARLVNASTDITITNNGGKDTYVFNDNDEFTFEFVDSAGNTGTAKAKVDWIDKSTPTVDVNYKLDADKKLIAILDNISEDVYILDENNRKTNFVEVEDGKVVNISYLNNDGTEYKIIELGELNGERYVNKVTYHNTIKEVPNVKFYVTSYSKGQNGEEVKTVSCFDENGEAVTVEPDDLHKLEKLEEARSNPLEVYLEDNSVHEFKLMDKASNIAYKSIRVDYIENDTKILTSAITYDITNITEKPVTATITASVISEEGKSSNVKVINNNGSNSYTFDKNGKFTFEYATYETQGSSEIINPTNASEHTATVSWIKEKQEDVLLYGDVNEDSNLSADDLAIIQLYNIDKYTFTEKQKRIADMDKNGEITANDLAVLQKILIE